MWCSFHCMEINIKICGKFSPRMQLIKFPPELPLLAVLQHARSSFNKKYYELPFEGPGYSYYTSTATSPASKGSSLRSSSGVDDGCKLNIVSYTRTYSTQHQLHFCNLWKHSLCLTSHRSLITGCLE